MELPGLPFHIYIDFIKDDSNVRTGYIVHVENPQFLCGYSINKPPEKPKRLLLHFKDYNAYLFDWELVDGSRLKVEYSELFYYMLEAARFLDAMLFFKFRQKRWPLKEDWEFAPPLDPETMARLRKGIGTPYGLDYYKETKAYDLDREKEQNTGDDEDDLPF